ncbi:MFS transporter [Sinomonas halotolerans]|uniref:MFS transporter n=1 Tax=Sinomonas halotolerans TaxID=1644133 RepID=A0ABU9WY70_9MICC
MALRLRLTAGRQWRAADVPPVIRHWRLAVVTAYTASGVAFSSWVTRLPAMREDLGLSPGGVGLLLLCMTLASFVSVSASGLIVIRLGSARTIRAGAALLGVGLVLMGTGASLFRSPLVTAIGFAVIGLGTASWNTASNVEGAALERALGRFIMPALHGSFSIGTVAGAALGAWAAAAALPLAWHLGVAGTVVAAAVVGTAAFLRADTHSAGVPVGAGDEGAAHDAVRPGGRAQVAAAWRDRRTVLLGLMVLGLALAEGAAGDWVAIALADGYGVSHTTGAIGYTVFVTAMAAGRFLGTPVLNRHGRVTSLRACGAFAILGLGLFVFAPSLWLAFAGLALWGIGASLGFPVGMSAAADDPVHAAARVSVVSTIGYGAFLCGPPLLGFVAELTGVRYSLLVVLAFVAGSVALAAQAAPRSVAEIRA